MKFISKETLSEIGYAVALIIVVSLFVIGLSIVLWPLPAPFLICGAMGVIGWTIKKVFYFILELFPWTKSKSVGDK